MHPRCSPDNLLQSSSDRISQPRIRSSSNVLLDRTAVHQERTLTWLGQLGWETFILPTPTSRAIINTGKKCGPSVAADGDLWTVYKLQSWNQQRCPKYVIRIDQSEWQGKHSLVRVPRLTNLPWRMGPSRGYRLIFFSFSEQNFCFRFPPAGFSDSGAGWRHYYLK